MGIFQLKTEKELLDAAEERAFFERFKIFVRPVGMSDSKLREFLKNAHLCSHDPVNTGFKKTWCKKCNRDGEYIKGRVVWENK